MRLFMFAFVLASVGSVVHADAPAKRPIEMGKWDCSGTKPIEVTIAPGELSYVWRGACSGAEGWSVVVEPKEPDLVTKEAYDAKKRELVLHVVNGGKRTVVVKLHVFVGFA